MNKKVNNENNVEMLFLNGHKTNSTSIKANIPVWPIILLIALSICLVIFCLYVVTIIDGNEIKFLGILGTLFIILIPICLIVFNVSNTKEINTSLVNEVEKKFLIVDTLEKEVKQEIFVPEIVTVPETKPRAARKKEVKFDKMFKEMADQFNEFFNAKGYNTKFGGEFISSMLYSRLIILKEGHDINVIKHISNAFNVGSIIIDNEDYNDKSVVLESGFNQLLKIASSDLNRPCFVFINNLTAEEFYYLDDVLSYIDSPNEKISIGDVTLPKNLFFVVSLKENESHFDIDRKYLRLAYVTKFEYTPKDVEDVELEYIHYSLINVERFLKRPDQKNSLPEEMWKKMDGLVELIHDMNGEYLLNNKNIIRLENFFISYFECEDKTPLQAFDLGLSSTILNDALLEGVPTDFVKDYDLFNYLYNQFGEHELVLCENLIKDYYKLFDSEGHRHYE